jgi:hypothetical protein
MASTRSAMWLEHCGSHWLAVESYIRYPAALGTLWPKTLFPSIFTTRKDWEKHLFHYNHASEPLEPTPFAWSANTPAAERARLED